MDWRSRVRVWAENGMVLAVVYSAFGQFDGVFRLMLTAVAGWSIIERLQPPPRDT